MSRNTNHNYTVNYIDGVPHYTFPTRPAPRNTKLS